MTTVSYFKLGEHAVAQKKSDDTVLIRLRIIDQLAMTDTAPITVNQVDHFDAMHAHYYNIIVTNELCEFFIRHGIHNIKSDLSLYFKCSAVYLTMFKTQMCSLDSLYIDQHTTSNTFKGYDEVLAETDNTVFFCVSFADLPFAQLQDILKHFTKVRIVTKFYSRHWLKRIFFYEGIIHTGDTHTIFLSNLYISMFISNTEMEDDFEDRRAPAIKQKMVAHVNDTTSIRQRNWPDFCHFLIEMGFEEYI